MSNNEPHSEQAPEQPLLRLSDNLLFASRLVLYPLNLGLLVALTIYMASFLWQVVELVSTAPSHVFNHGQTHPELTIQMVNLLDQTMIAYLLITTVLGGHQIYVRRFRTRSKESSLPLLDRMDAIMLKVKVGLAFVGVSSVVLLEDCLAKTVVPSEVWVQHIAIHLTFLATTLIIAAVWRIMHPPSAK